MLLSPIVIILPSLNEKSDIESAIVGPQPFSRREMPLTWDVLRLLFRPNSEHQPHFIASASLFLI